MMPLDNTKTKVYTFILPILYGNTQAERDTNNFKDIHDVYIDKNAILYCVNSNYNIIYTCQITDKYIQDFELFTNGKYSQFSPEFKLLILKFWLGDDILLDILFKSNDGKKLTGLTDFEILTGSETRECWYKPTLRTECINRFKLKNT